MTAAVTRKRVDSALASFEKKNEDNRANNIASSPTGTGKAGHPRRTSGISSRSRKHNLSLSLGSISPSVSDMVGDERRFNRHIRSNSGTMSWSSSCNDLVSSPSRSTITTPSPQSTTRNKYVVKRHLASVLSRPPLHNSSPDLGVSQVFKECSRLVNDPLEKGGSYAPPWLSQKQGDEKYSQSPGPRLKVKISTVIATTDNNSPGGTSDTQSITSASVASEASSSVSSLRKKFSSRKGRSSDIERSATRSRRGKSLERSDGSKITEDVRLSSSMRSTRTSLPFRTIDNDDELLQLPSRKGNDEAKTSEKNRPSSSRRLIDYASSSRRHSIESFSPVLTPSQRKFKVVTTKDSLLAKTKAPLNDDLRNPKSPRSVTGSRENGKDTMATSRKDSASEKTSEGKSTTKTNKSNKTQDSSKVPVQEQRKRFLRRTASPSRTDCGNENPPEDRVRRVLRSESTSSAGARSRDSDGNRDTVSPELRRGFPRRSVTSEETDGSMSRSQEDSSQKSVRNNSVSATANARIGKSDNDGNTPVQRKQLTQTSLSRSAVVDLEPKSRRYDWASPELRRHLSARSINSVQSEESSSTISSSEKTSEGKSTTKTNKTNKTQDRSKVPVPEQRKRLLRRTATPSRTSGGNENPPEDRVRRVLRSKSTSSAGARSSARGCDENRDTVSPELRRGFPRRSVTSEETDDSMSRSQEDSSQKSVRSNSVSATANARMGNSENDGITPVQRKQLTQTSLSRSAVVDLVPESRRYDWATPELRRHLSSRSINSLQSEESSSTISSSTISSSRHEKEYKNSKRPTSTSSHGSSSSLPREVQGNKRTASSYSPCNGDSPSISQTEKTGISSTGTTEETTISSTPRRTHISRKSCGRVLGPLQETGESGNESEINTPKRAGGGRTAFLVSKLNRSLPYIDAPETDGSQRHRRSLDGSETKRSGRDFDMESESKAFQRSHKTSSSSRTSPPGKEVSRLSHSRKKDVSRKKIPTEGPGADAEPSAKLTSAAPRQRKKLDRQR